MEQIRDAFNNHFWTVLGVATALSGAGGAWAFGWWGLALAAVPPAVTVGCFVYALWGFKM